MAILTFAKDNEIGSKAIATKYEEPEDLIRLVTYHFNKSKFYTLHNLQDLGLDNILSQMLYVQKCRVKIIDTRALHFIISFDNATEKYATVTNLKRFMKVLNNEIFKDNQFIQFLRTDNKQHYIIHIIVNPVNLSDYHITREGLIQLAPIISNELYMQMGLKLKVYPKFN